MAIVMTIVVDTNVFYGDPNLTGPKSQTLLKGAARSEIHLVVPRIVVEELVKHHFDQVSGVTEQIKGQVNKLRKLTEDRKQEDPDLPDPGLEASAYRERVQTRLSVGGAEIMDTPEVNHGLLVRKAIYRKRPFQSNGRGYQDALIWESVKFIAVQRKVAFVSGNSKDFLDEAGNLHPDLLAELSEMSLARNSVVPYSSLDAFIDAVIKPRLEQLEELRQSLEHGTLEEFDLELALNEILENEASSWDWTPTELELPAGSTEPHVKATESPRGFDVMDVRRLSDEGVITWVCLDVLLYIWFFAPRSASEIWSESSYSIDELEWNESVMTVETYRHVSLCLYVSISTSRWEVTGAEMDEFSVIEPSRS
jgi:hypothetical protein